MEVSRVHPVRNKPIIGLAGGVGAGKSAVAGILESLGSAVIDSDQLVREQFRDPEVITTLKGWWGEAVCHAGLGVDRQAVAEIVFNDPDQLARLERLLYPRLACRREALLASYDADPMIQAIVLDAPKLYEAGLDGLCDAVIFVDTDRQVRVQRLAASRGWTEEELARRENLLEPLDRKKAIADYIVVNHASTAEVRSQIEGVFASVLANFFEDV